MSLPQELQAFEREHGNTRLRTLLAEFADTLERLPKMWLEVETWMETSGIDWADLAQRLEPQLVAATDWLLDFDMLPLAIQVNPTLQDFMQRATATITSRTVATIVNKYESVKQEVDKYNAINSIIKYTQSGLIDNENGTVTDPRTGLMWKRVIEGQFTWNDMIKKFQGHDSFTGYNDWRLPTLEELRTLTLSHEECPPIDLEAFPKGEGWVWSNTADDNYSCNVAWCIYFGDGYAYDNSRHFRLGVRLVREF